MGGFTTLPQFIPKFWAIFCWSRSLVHGDPHVRIRPFPCTPSVTRPLTRLSQWDMHLGLLFFVMFFPPICSILSYFSHEVWPLESQDVCGTLGAPPHSRDTGAESDDAHRAFDPQFDAVNGRRGRPFASPRSQGTDHCDSAQQLLIYLDIATLK
jgi:hypothetical protein